LSFAWWHQAYPRLPRWTNREEVQRSLAAVPTPSRVPPLWDGQAVARIVRILAHRVHGPTDGASQTRLSQARSSFRAAALTHVWAHPNLACDIAVPLHPEAFDCLTLQACWESR
jgi:hypothetical protein